MRKRLTWLWQAVAALAVVGALGFGAQTVLAERRADECNPLPSEYGGPTCTAQGCEDCCQDHFDLEGTCFLFDACVCG
ncbi:MAG: hypothetical protein WD934_03155 [Gemmatimonadales bacterium]